MSFVKHTVTQNYRNPGRGRDAFLSVGGAAIVEVSLKAIVEMNRQRGELDLVQTKIQTALCGARFAVFRKFMISKYFQHLLSPATIVPFGSKVIPDNIPTEWRPEYSIDYGR